MGVTPQVIHLQSLSLTLGGSPTPEDLASFQLDTLEVVSYPGR